VKQKVAEVVHRHLKVHRHLQKAAAAVARNLHHHTANLRHHTHRPRTLRPPTLHHHIRLLPSVPLPTVVLLPTVALRPTTAHHLTAVHLQALDGI
jgi:hypothetical protein